MYVKVLYYVYVNGVEKWMVVLMWMLDKQVLGRWAMNPYFKSLKKALQRQKHESS